MDAALLWLLIAAWSRGGTTRDAVRPRRAPCHDRETGKAAADRASVPLRPRLHARSAWLRALEEVALVDRRMKPSPIRKLW
jgi:hypothetical protein